MDPTQVVTELRAEITDLSHGGSSDPWDHPDFSPTLEGIVERFAALDEWLTKGGFLPEQWAKRRGRPRRKTDGQVLADVEHGKARSYNLGCRCLECTKANRVKGALWRQTHPKES